MKSTVAILLDADRVRVLAPSAVLGDVAWNPDTPEEAAAALGPVLGRASQAVLVVGLGLLELAQPELPPLAPDQRHALLLRDADRYFPISDPVAVSWGGGTACATSSARLAAWVHAFSRHCVVSATTTVTDCLARASANGTWSVPAGPGERGRVAIRSGAVQEVRRVPKASPLALPHLDDSAARSPDLGAIARGAEAALDAPLHALLLDAPLSQRFARARRARLARSVAALLLAATALGWSADRWRGQQRDAADARLRFLATEAEPALRSAARLQRARDERALLDATARNEPAMVLERLGALLPRDAFIQRLDWDGSIWRIEGSAASAPRIVPLLDADARLDDVRIVAATARFLDAGAQRESFSISFRSTPAGVTGAAR